MATIALPLPVLTLTPLLAAAVACGTTTTPSDDTEGSTSEDTSTSAGQTSGGPTSSSSTSSGTSTSTGSSGGEAGSTSEEDSAGFIPNPDGGTGGAGTGFCIGVRQVGNLATVHTQAEPLGELSCETTPTNCGTDPVGTWTARTHCGLEQLPNFFEAQCPGSTMAVLSSDVQGSRTFGEDLSYSEQFTVFVDAESRLDTQACFGLSCDAFGDILDQEENLSAVCTEDAEGCGCLLMIADDSTRSGTYDVTEDGVVITADGFEASPTPFCVEGDSLTLWDPLVENQAHQDVFCGDEQDCVDAFEDDPDQADVEWFCVQ